MKIQKRIFSIFVIGFLLGLVSCSRNEDNPVPQTYVDFYVYLNEPSNIKLNSPGGWVYFSGGSKGIVVYRLDIDHFKAFDRNCTYNSSLANAQVSVDSSGLFLADNSCGSKFVIIDGSVNNGPATVPLRQYIADYDGVGIVHVHN